MDGYKTYLAAALLAAVALAEGLLGVDVPGVVLEDNWFFTFISALGLGGVGHKLAKLEKR